MTPNGDIYQSALEDASSWNALDFIGSQIEPDSGVYLAKFQNYIAAFKGWSTEFFYDAANATGSILSPVQNAHSGRLRLGQFCAGNGRHNRMDGADSGRLRSVGVSFERHISRAHQQ